MRILTMAILAASAAALSACSGLGGKQQPDEFAVAREAPLVVPPDFALRPPKPGAPRPQEVDAQSQAMQALFGPTATVPGRTPGEDALLSKAGANRSTADIRSTVKDDGTIVADKGAMLKEILSTESGKTTDGATIGAAPPPKQ